MTIMEDTSRSSWISPIQTYIKHGMQPTNPIEFALMKVRASLYYMIRIILYIKVLLTPLLKCLEGEEAMYTLVEVHKGIVAQHLSYMALAKIVLMVRYYWSFMV